MRRFLAEIRAPRGSTIPPFRPLPAEEVAEEEEAVAEEEEEA